MLKQEPYPKQQSLFKLGDKVICVNNEGQESNLELGRVYTVSYEESDRPWDGFPIMLKEIAPRMYNYLRFRLFTA